VTLRARWVTLRARWVMDAKSSLGDAKSWLGDATSSLGDVKSSLGDAESSLGDATSSLGDVQAVDDDLRSWLSSQGLTEGQTMPLPGKPTSFIDISYVDDELRVHTGESGTKYVLQRMRAGDAFHLPCIHRHHGATMEHRTTEGI
jgi:hypothetical protein